MYVWEYKSDNYYTVVLKSNKKNRSYCCCWRCLSPNNGLKLIALISIGLAIVVAYFSVSIIWSSLANSSEIEQRRTKLESGLEDLEEEMRPDSAEINTALTKNLAEHRMHSAKVSNILLISGILALAAGSFQLLSSLFLYFNYHDDDQDSVQYWSIVSCAVFLCLAACLILLLCLDTNLVPFLAREIIFIVFITIDALFSMYSIWLILSTV